MGRRYQVYKGLQKPLTYRGFKGKFIYWGIGALLTGLVLGALTMALVNMWLGLIVLIGFIAGGLLFIAGKQKKGLHIKSRPTGIFIHQVNFRRINQHGRKASF
jgi:hypothetical protein